MLLTIEPHDPQRQIGFGERRRRLVDGFADDVRGVSETIVPLLDRQPDFAHRLAGDDSIGSDERTPAVVLHVSLNIGRA